MSGRTSADTAILDCRIRTLDPRRPSARAVAVREGVIVAVGEVAEVRDCCDARTRIIDGTGHVLTPGLVDLHQHTVYALPFLRGADLTQARSLGAMKKAMADERRRVGDGEWVLGWGLSYDVFGSERVSNRALEDAVAGAPALIRMYDGHAAVATQRAIEIAGLTEPFEFPDGSLVVFSEEVPTGEVREMAAVSAMAAAVPPLGRELRKKTMGETLARFNATGLTQIHLMCDRGEPVELARDLEETDGLTVRLVIPVWVRPGDTPDRRAEQLATLDERGELWRRGVAKFFADGVIDNGTAWLEEPDTRGEGQQPVWPDRDELRAAVRVFSEAGFQCAAHAIGDAAVADVLDAYLAAGSPADRMHRIEHLETLPDRLVERCGSEQVALSMQPIGLCFREDDDSDAWARNLGRERAEQGWRCADLLRAGAVLSLSSDFPVAPFDPRLGMAWARLRREPKTARAPFQADQALSGLQALEGYTSTAARVLGEDRVSGRIAEGFRADMTAFAADPVDCDGDDLPDLPVLFTMVAGRLVYGEGAGVPAPVEA